MTPGPGDWSLESGLESRFTLKGNNPNLDDSKVARAACHGLAQLGSSQFGLLAESVSRSPGPGEGTEPFHLKGK